MARMISSKNMMDRERGRTMVLIKLKGSCEFSKGVVLEFVE